MTKPDRYLYRLQKIQLEMLEEVKRICEKHSIEYFLIAGSALGAVRHNNMIPWDDYIDVGILRPDYERFLVVARDQLKKTYFLQNHISDPEAPYQFTKIRKNNTRFVEEGIKKLNIHKGIYIDIFPFDNYASKKYQRIVQYFLLIFASAIRQSATLEMCLASKSKIRKITRVFMYFIRKSIFKRLMDKFENKIMTFFNNKESDFVCCYELCGINNYFKKTVIKKSFIVPTVLKKFGKVNYPIPGNYDAYLKQIFGDYMKYPPIKERRPRHRICELNFKSKE